jgi:hypothetical protein
MARSKENKDKSYLKKINLKPGKFRKDFLTPEERKGKKTIGFKDGGSLKPVPAEKKGLKKLPTKIRNKMGFMNKGGRVGLKSGGLAKRGKGCEIK